MRQYKPDAEEKDMTRPLIIYHGNCMDGSTAAWCFWRKYRDQADFVAGYFDQPAPDVAGRSVFLLDFSYKRPIVAAMLQSAASVTLIDHHKSALEDLANLPGLHYFTDLERSGATLAWDYLFPGEARPSLLNHIEDRDLWRFQLPATREILAGLYSYDFSFALWDELMQADQAHIAQMALEGRAIERNHHKNLAHMVQTCQRRMVIGGVDVPVANIPGMMASDAGHLMAQGEVFAACYTDTASGRKFELRASATGSDVSLVALEYGGGGHAKAAGFMVPRSHPLAQA